ncbi:hypothetical protein [Paraburkholderia mimosarum]|nr:hypothetical protein [Paraburkholderia mimosarum]
MLNAVQSTLEEDSALRADVLAVLGYIVNTYEWLQGEIAAASEGNTAASPGDIVGENRDAPAAENSNSNQSADAPVFH